MAQKLRTAQVFGIEGRSVTVEVDVAPGMHKFTLVGLPDKAVEESRERINAAIKNSGLRAPQKTNQRITINLAPANLKKEGAFFDLPIALCYLLTTKQIQFDPASVAAIGELGLDGALRPVRGIISIAHALRKEGVETLIVPKENAREAALIPGIAIYGAASLGEAIDHLESRIPIQRTRAQKLVTSRAETPHDFAHIKGQLVARRAAEIAAAGMHHLGLIGPPGTGKTLIARALPSILPSPTIKELLEIIMIKSAAGERLIEQQKTQLSTARPFRSPHHTSSHAAVVGGGAVPTPGEITLAHRGVLFLDEFPEFSSQVIEALREPLEDRVITVSRVRGSFLFPANVLLVAAMNPCPCGNRGSQKICSCSPAHLARYDRRLSGPIVDRIDLWADVLHIDYDELDSSNKAESSEEIRTRVERAYDIQKERFAGKQEHANSDIHARDIPKYCFLDADCSALLREAATALELSPRSYHRVCKVARTIADLGGSKNIQKPHILEALQFRPRIG